MVAVRSSPSDWPASKSTSSESEEEAKSGRSAVDSLVIGCVCDSSDMVGWGIVYGESRMATLPWWDLDESVVGILWAQLWSHPGLAVVGHAYTVYSSLGCKRRECCWWSLVVRRGTRQIGLDIGDIQKHGLTICVQYTWSVLGTSVTWQGLFIRL